MQFSITSCTWLFIPGDYVLLDIFRNKPVISNRRIGCASVSLKLLSIYNLNPQNQEKDRKWKKICKNNNYIDNSCTQT